MAFEKRNWSDRVVEAPNRRVLTPDNGTNIGQIYFVRRDEGLVYEEGDSWSADNMNDLELRISNYGGDVEALIAKIAQDLASLNTNTANTYMPKSGGTFTGAVQAQSANRNGQYVRNIVVQNSGGASVDSNYIIARRS